MKKRSIIILLLVTAITVTLAGKAIATESSNISSVKALSKIEGLDTSGKFVDVSSSSPQDGRMITSNNDQILHPVAYSREGVQQFIPITQQEILQELIRYKELADAFAMQPGWTLVKFDQFDLIHLNSPKPLPSTYQKEFWSHFDQNQKVFEQVDYVISTETGKVPLGVLANGKLVSLWNDGQILIEEPYTPSYDLYLVSSIQALIESKISFTLSYKQELLGDQSTALIELQTQFSDADKQLFNLQLSQPVWGQFEKFYFNPLTGLLLRYEHSYILEDMSLVFSSITDNFEYIPNSEPPSDVINLLTMGGN